MEEMGLTEPMWESKFAPGPTDNDFSAPIRPIRFLGRKGIMIQQGQDGSRRVYVTNIAMALRETHTKLMEITADVAASSQSTPASVMQVSE